MKGESNKQIFDRWLSDGQTCIGVFENKAMDSATAGMRTALSYELSQWDQLVVGKTTAPDSKFGAGWKFLLVAKCKTTDEALKAMEGESCASE